jgi:elongation factor Ts
MLDKIAQGKLNAFFKESTLTAQAFVKEFLLICCFYVKQV